MNVNKGSKLFKRVEVTWYDASWAADVEIKEILGEDMHKRFVKRNTLGWLIKQDKEGIVVAVDIQEQGVCDIFSIPAGFKPEVKYI